MTTSPPPTNSIGIITASFARDIDAFTTLRASLDRFAPSLTQWAVVHREDLPLFKKRFGNHPSLILKGTDEVLPAGVERLRRAFRHRWLKDIYRLLYARWYSGWHFQQLTKIYTLAQFPFEVGLFLDSDCLIREPFDGRWCFDQQGNLKCFRRPATNAEQCAFDATTYRLLRKPLHHVSELYDYIYQPTLFYRRTAIRLLQELNKRSAWHYRFLNESMPSEYHLLGYCATQLEQLEGYTLDCGDPEAYHHALRYHEHRRSWDSLLCDITEHPKPFVWLQSTLRLSPQERTHLIERINRITPAPSLKG